MKNAVATAATLGVIAFAASAYGEKMGHDSVGKWRVEKDELCLDTATEPGGGCYQGWVLVQPTWRLVRSGGSPFRFLRLL